MGKSTVFNGSFIKLLKSNINLKDAAYILTSTVDPRVTATSAPEGSLLLRNNTSGNGQLFIKLDSGSTTNWYQVANEGNLTIPFAMSEASSPSRVLTVGVGNVIDPDTGRHRRVQPINNYTPVGADLNSTFTVTLPTTGAGNVTTPSGANLPLGMSASQFCRVAIHVQISGNTFLTKGDAASTLTGAPYPKNIKGSFPVGHVVVRTDASNNVQNITANDIYQYVGDAEFPDVDNTDRYLASLKDQLMDSPYSLVTPWLYGKYIYNGGNVMWNLPSTVTDFGNYTIPFSANGQIASTALNALDPVEFLAQSLDVTQIDLVAYWSQNFRASGGIQYEVPTAFTYEVSRDGGTNWFPVTMTRVGAATGTYAGALTFDQTATTEGTRQTIVNNAFPANNPLDLLGYQVGSSFTTVASVYKLQEVTFALKRGPSVPSGSITIQIVKDSAGLPSTNPNDVLSVSQSYAISSLGLSTSFNTLSTLNLGPVIIQPGTYHVVIVPDAVYIAGYNANNNAYISVATSLVGANFAETRSSAGNNVWVSASPQGIATLIKGRILDLRARITSAGSPTYPVGLDGVALFYDLQSGGVIGATRKTARRTFNSVTDNTSTFTITEFNPDPDLLTCFYVEGGQSFKVPSFALNGNVVTFPTNSFNNGGVSATITLIFDQNNGGAYDNSDSNRRLLAANHLGSTNGTDDLSSAGRGPILRRPDGTLRELYIDNNDNISILSVP